MILKSYLVENDLNNLKNFKFILFYGENIGLKHLFKKLLSKQLADAEVVSIYQEDFSKNKDLLIEECKNVSLFSKKKTIIVNQANDKLLDNIKYLIEDNIDVKIILFADNLEKKSKIRSYFEKDKSLAIIPCYEDNEITLKKIILQKLKGFKNLNSNTVNMILTYSNLNRNNIINNIDKITIYFDNKILDENALENILNSDRNETFEKIRDATLNQDKKKLNQLIKDFNFNNEDVFYYLNTINFRLLKILEVHKIKTKNDSIEDVISRIKPPIFWKDKPTIINLAKKWDKQRLLDAIVYFGKIEKSLKTNTNVNSLTLIKNSIMNVCSNSWAYF